MQHRLELVVILGPNSDDGHYRPEANILNFNFSEIQYRIVESRHYPSAKNTKIILLERAIKYIL